MNINRFSKVAARRLCLTVVAVAAIVGGVGVASPAFATSYTDYLPANTNLVVGDTVTSVSGQFHLTMQGDGNAVLYSRGSQRLWSSNTSTGVKLVAQGDGNVVVYNSSGSPVYQSGSSGSGVGGKLSVQNDGNLVFYNSGGGLIWNSGTHLSTLAKGENLQPNDYIQSPDGRFKLTMQTDGSLVIYDTIASHSTSVWSRSTAAGGYAVFQTDGNFVLYPTVGGAASYSSGTASSGAGFYLENSGSFVIKNSGGTRIYSSGGYDVPVSGTVTGVLGGSPCGTAGHSGYDIAPSSGASTGDKTVHAAAAGTVSAAGADSGYGNYIVINHNNGQQTFYAHLASTSVSLGWQVWQQEAIGVAGSTGSYATGLHLHVAIQPAGSTIGTNSETISALSTCGSSQIRDSQIPSLPY